MAQNRNVYNQFVYILMLTYTGQYLQIHTDTDTYRAIPSNTYNTYHYLLIKYRLLHTMNTNTYHTSNTGQYRAIHKNMYLYIPIHTMYTMFVTYVANTNQKISIPAHMIFGYTPIYTNTYQK